MTENNAQQVHYLLFSPKFKKYRNQLFYEITEPFFKLNCICKFQTELMGLGLSATDKAGKSGSYQ